MRISCLSTLGLVGASFAAPHAFVLHEKRESIPSNWIKKDRAPADAELSIQSDIDLGQDPSTDPASPQFGKHLPPKRVAETFSPSGTAVDSVRDWLIKSAARARKNRISPEHELTISVSDLETLLQTQLYIYEDSKMGTISISCEEYHVPESIGHHVDSITPVDQPQKPLRY